MGQSKRYSVRANPQIKNGAMVTRSFRMPQSVADLFDQRVAELKDDPEEPGMLTATDAHQDAIVKWLMLEGK